MKTLSIVTLAVAIMTGVVVNAAAQDLAINPPDINGKLDTLVERKMNTLMEDKDTVQDQSGVREEANTTGEQPRDVNQNSFIYVVTDSRR